jgi:hypothetical protein
VSAGVVAFTLDFDRLERLWGSRLQKAIDRILARVNYDHADDEWSDDDGEDGEERPPSIEDALHHIVMGQPLREDWPTPYCLALLAICHDMGHLLPAGALFQPSPELIDAADKQLARYRYPPGIRISNVLMRGLPVFGFDGPDDLPWVGHITPQEVSDAPSMTQMWSGSPAVAEGLYQFAAWMNAANDRGHGLVAFTL